MDESTKAEAIKLLQEAIHEIESTEDLENGRHLASYIALDAIVTLFGNNPCSLVDTVRTHLDSVQEMFDGEKLTAYKGSTLVDWEEASGLVRFSDSVCYWCDGMNVNQGEEGDREVDPAPCQVCRPTEFKSWRKRNGQ